MTVLPMLFRHFVSKIGKSVKIGRLLGSIVTMGEVACIEVVGLHTFARVMTLLKESKSPGRY
jgi:hypothetical protein